MTEKEKLKEMAKLFRENAGILEELAGDVNKDRAEELAALYLIKVMKISDLQ